MSYIKWKFFGFPKTSSLALYDFIIIIKILHNLNMYVPSPAGCHFNTRRNPSLRFGVAERPSVDRVTTRRNALENISASRWWHSSYRDVDRQRISREGVSFKHTLCTIAITSISCLEQSDDMHRKENLINYFNHYWSVNHASQKWRRPPRKYE